jgi:hypothetical protein
MAVTVSYRGDNTGRRAIIDLIRWFGLHKSKIIFRAVRQCETFQELDQCNMAISFGGVQGEPVRRLIAYCHSDDVLARWIKAPNGDKSRI